MRDHSSEAGAAGTEAGMVGAGIQTLAGEPQTDTATEPPKPGTAGTPWWRTLLGSFLHRLIDVRTLSWPLRLALAWAIFQSVVVGVLIAARDVLQPHVTVEALGGGTATMPLAAEIASFICIAVAWLFLLTGALYSKWTVGAPILLIFTVFIAYTLMPSLTSDPTQLLALGSVLLLLWGWALMKWLRDAWAARRGGRGALPHWRSACAVAVVLLFYNAFYLIPTVLVRSGQEFTVFTLVQITGLGFLLIPAYFLVGSDFAETAETIAERVVGFAGRLRSPWVVVALTTLLACGMLVRVVIEAGPGAPWSPQLVLSWLVLVGMLLGGSALATRLGNVRRWPAMPLPYGALLVVSVTYIGIATIPNVSDTALAAISIVLAAAVGLPLLLRGRRVTGPWAVTGLFLLVLGSHWLVISLEPVVAQMLRVNPEGLRSSGVPSYEAPLALLTLAVVVWIVARRRVSARTAELLALLFALDAGLVLLNVVFQRTYAQSLSTGQPRTVLQALLLVGAFLWDLLTSGEQITNVNGRRIPRRARVLLYLSFTMVTSVTVLYFSSQTLVTQGPIAINLAAEQTSTANDGLVLLGIPVLLTGFFLKLGQWWHRGHPEVALIPRALAKAAPVPAGAPMPHMPPVPAYAPLPGYAPPYAQPIPGYMPTYQQPIPGYMPPAQPWYPPTQTRPVNPQYPPYPPYPPYPQYPAGPGNPGAPMPSFPPPRPVPPGYPPQPMQPAAYPTQPTYPGQPPYPPYPQYLPYPAAPQQPSYGSPPGMPVSQPRPPEVSGTPPQATAGD